MNRILWNRRPAGPYDVGDIDEIVMTGADVHIEQMGVGCWWIELRQGDTYWHGNFTPHGFGEQENAGIAWDRDDTHEAGT